jgi:enamine deaminase RidA (YjgF/YER057c/UK114 family)
MRMTPDRRTLLSLLAAAPFAASEGHAMPTARHDLIAARIAALNIDLGKSAPGGAYSAVVEDQGVVQVSGMVPSLDGVLVSTGAVGAEVTLEQAQYAAKISALRCLNALREHLGDLGRIRHVTKMTVYVRTAPGFYQISEVSNGASELLAAILSPNGRHARTSVGVAALPRNAPLELDMTVTIDPA